MYFYLQCSVSSPEEEKLITIKRPKTPVSNDLSDINTQTNWTKSLPLPTPEEKMRQQAQAVQTDVVPINVTGRLLISEIVLRWLGRGGIIGDPLGSILTLKCYIFDA